MPPATTTTTSTIDWSILGSTESTQFNRELYEADEKKLDGNSELFGLANDEQGKRMEEGMDYEFISVTSATPPALITVSSETSDPHDVQDEITSMEGKSEGTQIMYNTQHHKVTAITATTPALDSNNFQQEPEVLMYREPEMEYSKEEYKEFFIASSSSNNKKGEEEYHNTEQAARMLDDHQNEDENVRSIVSVERCTFAVRLWNMNLWKFSSTSSCILLTALHVVVDLFHLKHHHFVLNNCTNRETLEMQQSL